MSGYDLSVLPDQPKQYDLSLLPDQPKALPTQGISPYDEFNQPIPSETDAAISAANQRAPMYAQPPAPANLLRENAPQIQQDVWNMASPPPTVGPILEHPLRPDVSYATGVMQNLEVGLRLGFDRVVANLISLPAGLTPASVREDQEPTGAGQAFPTREAISNSTLNAMNKALQVDKVAPPKDFADALARGVGESGAPLAETMALSYLTASLVSPLTAGLAEKVPYLYSWLFPIARDAITFGTQSALEPGATAKSVEVGAGSGAILGMLGLYGRLARVLGGAAIGAGIEYETNPQAQPMDYARNAALMGAFAAIGGVHGITPGEAAAFTIMDWAKGKGYAPEVLERAIKMQGIGAIANEFGEDVAERSSPLSPQSPQVEPPPDTALAPEAANALPRQLPTLPWPENFPNARTHTTITKLTEHPDHAAAKAGDAEAALRLVDDLIKPEKIIELGNRHPNARIVPVHAEEAAGRNKILAVFAETISDLTGLPVEEDIAQTNVSAHTEKGAFERLLSLANFTGRVKPGQKYIIVDDAIT